MKRKTALIALVLLASACGGQNVKVQPLTNEQKLAIFKIGAQTAASGLEIRIAHLKQDPKEAEHARILEIVKGFLDEFNRQTADVTALDFTSQETIRAAEKKAFDAAENLTNTDVLNLNDPVLKADIVAAIKLARSAVAAFDTLLPAPSK